MEDINISNLKNMTENFGAEINQSFHSIEKETMDQLNQERQLIEMNPILPPDKLEETHETLSD